MNGIVVAVVVGDIAGKTNKTKSIQQAETENVADDGTTPRSSDC